MDTFSSFMGTSGVDRLESLFKFKDVSPKTQAHLKEVYLNLCQCTFVCALGAYINSTFFIQGFLMNILAIIGMGYLGYKVSNPYESEKTRNLYLLGLAFAMGYLIGPLMHHLAYTNPQIIVQAVGYTAVTFGSFSAVALFSKRRSHLYLGGVISSMVSAMFFYKMLSWVFGYGYHQFGLGFLLLGLFVECLYIIFDTQMIIELAETRGEKDVPKHTMILFLDLVNLFIKIVQILIKLSEDSDKKKKKK